MAYRNLKDFIIKLEEEEELIRVNEFVNPELEISEITDRFSKAENGGKAILFENTGSSFPVLTNSMGSDKRMAIALGVRDINEIVSKLESLFKNLKEPGKSLFEKLKVLSSIAKFSKFFPVEQKGKAACQEVVYRNPDLSILPVLKTWPFDGGKFITLPLVFTIDPETGERNVGMYRMQIIDRQTTGMHWHRHKTGANHYEKYKKAGLKMPVAIALGGDPSIIYSATAPLPENMDELLLAGFLRDKPVTLTNCLSQNIQIPADSEIIIEGYVDPEEDKILEGPFGDHTGFYSLEDYYPVFHVTCITHRKNAVYPATLVGIPPMEDAWIAKVTERIFLMPIRLTIAPEIIDMYIPEFGVAHNLTIVSIHKTFPGQAIKVMNSLWGAGQMMFNKVLIVCDSKINIHNLDEVYNKLLETDIQTCLNFSAGPLDVLDHSSDFTGFGSKLGIDLTFPLEGENKQIYNPSSCEGTDSKEIILPAIYNITHSRQIKNEKNQMISFIGINKGKDYNLKKILNALTHIEGLRAINVFLLIDHLVDLYSFKEFLWYFLNNMEPKRDVLRIQVSNDEIILLIDGTSKNFESDLFGRDWPNPVTMDEKTIKKIDQNWDKYHLGSFIQSPSIRYNKLVREQGARAYINTVSKKN